MKKYTLLLFILICSILTACKKDEIVEIETTDIENIPGVEVLERISRYDYSYSEQQDGSLLFTVGGNWEESQTWSITSDTEGIALVEELAQTKEEAKYSFVPQKSSKGYSEYELQLTDTATKEVSYTFVISLMKNEEQTKLSVLEVYFYEPSREEQTIDLTDTTEIVDATEIILDSEMMEMINESEEAFYEVVGEISFPKEFTVEQKSVTSFERKGNEEKTGQIDFIYKDNLYSCIISSTIPLSYFQEVCGIESDLWEVTLVNEVEVSSYTQNTTEYIMWKDTDGIRYVLVSKKEKDVDSLEVAKLFINQ